MKIFDVIIKQFEQIGIYITNISSRLSESKKDKNKKFILSHMNIDYKKVMMDEYIKKISLEVLILLYQLDIHIDAIPNCLKQIIYSNQTAKKEHFDYILAFENLNYHYQTVKKVSVKDIIGSVGNQEDISLLELVSKLYNDNHEYGSRNLGLLSNSINQNLDGIIKSDIPIRLIQIKDKYYVGNDGNHRSFYLLLAYLIERYHNENNPSKLQEIEEKFKIPALVQKKSPYEIINQICYCLSICGNSDLNVTFSSNSSSIGILNIGGKKIEIHSEEQFVQYFHNYLNSLDKNSEKYQLLFSKLIDIGYFSTLDNSDQDISSSCLDFKKR